MGSAMTLMKSRRLLFCHGFSGHNAISAIHGEDRKWPWQTWNMFGEVGNTFAKLSVTVMKILVLKGLLSSCTTGAMLLTNVDSSSLDLLALKQRTYESISPTHTALKELISVVQNCIVIHPEHDLCTLPTHQGTCEESAQNPV